ncbi:MAG: inorganic pyrophosphatase [Olpidium bornovanus]|uniref:inorganic diphosphatase n=1 Tax=Olpidium bornovanus TaxID=278681 RepID=A0A8H7ZUN5_9FUNG|nr:MAG: inorganic pyrophosphatase [Olpidium bornovanus]
MLLASSVFVIPPALAAPTTATARAAAAFSWCFSAGSHRRPVPPRALFFSSAPRKNSLALSLPLPRPFLRKSHHHGHTTRPTTAALCAAAVVRRAAMAFTTRHVGAPNSLDYRVFFERDGAPVSPFHDIPLHPGNDTNVYNMVVEIPRWTNAKLEVCPTLFYNLV